MRTPYQIYKENHLQASVILFNSLPPETQATYRILAAEESLTAHITFLTDHPEEKETYRISTTHSAASYMTQFVAVLPLMLRSSTANTVCINLKLLSRVIELLDLDATVLHTLQSTEEDGSCALSSSSTVTLQDLLSIEHYFSGIEQQLRQEARESKETIVMLRGPVGSTGNSPTKGVRNRTIRSGVEPPEKGEANLSSTNDALYPLSENVNQNLSSKEKKRRQTEATGLEPDAARPVKKLKTEDADPAKNKPLHHRSATDILCTTLATCGRLRQLSTQEKKISLLLQQMLQLLAHVYALKFNELVTVFDFLMQKVSVLEKLVAAVKKDASTAGPSADAGSPSKVTKNVPPPYFDVDVASIRSAIATANRNFRSDSEYQVELDEDLLHPIGYAVISELNRVEGFLTAPFAEPTEEEKKKKQAQRQASIDKRDELRRKAEAKQKEKEEKVAAQKRELTLLRQLLGGGSEEDWVEEDVSFLSSDVKLEGSEASQNKWLSSLPYVHYDYPLPLGSLELYEKALFIWCMISSMPETLQLSQMSFQTFCQGVMEDSEEINGLMEEVVQQLMKLAKEAFRDHSPSAARLQSRGKTWFGAMVDFVALASGNKKSSAKQKRNVSQASISDDDQEDDFNDDLDEDEEGEEEDAKPKDEGEASPPPARTFEDDLRETMERVNELHTRASWGNISILDRLNLVQFCVLEALGSNKVRAEADALEHHAEELAVVMERANREIRDEAEKHIRCVWKNNSSSKGRGEKKSLPEEENASSGVEHIIKEVQEKRHSLYATWIKKQEDPSVGWIIAPLGTDRFHRVYWRFPLDNKVYVQSTSETLPNFPILPKPSGFTLQSTPKPQMLLDDEEERGSPTLTSGTNATEAPAQRSWGIIPPSYLQTFAQGLDANGKHEGPLRRTLEGIAPSLVANEANANAFTRTTRSRAYMLGYSNSFKQTSYY